MTDDGQSSQLAALEKLLLDESADPVDLPFSLLKAITGNFSEDNKIGGGGFGAVYKGVLPSGRTIAVKKLFERFEILDKNFESEIACLVGVKHKNTVRFLGYCSETQHVMRLYEGRLVWADARQRLLCFEYLPKGCLADYLSDASCRLQWTTCYQIIKGICEGVHYLHQQRIIHMDLNPQNVLLDNNMVPRIADFGLSRRLSGSQSRAITDHRLGTMGYMAPEFLNNGEITFKTDIYSLGVIIMKILMRHKESSSVKEVVESWTDMFGTSNSHTSLEQVKACAEIGIECTNYYPGNRPATWFIIRGILGDAEISNWSVTSGVGTSTEGQISIASKLVDELKLMDGSVAAPSKLPPSTLEVEQDDGKLSQERKASNISFSKLADELKLMDNSVASGKLMDNSITPSQLQPSALEVEKEDGKISFSKLVDELKLMDDYVAPFQLQPSSLEVEQEDGKVSQQKKRRASTMSVATGVMSTLSGKLTTLVYDEYNKRKEVRMQASFLEKELSAINAALEKSELMDELTPWVKKWRDDLRDISYDMENCIDDFIRQFGDENVELCLSWETAELHKRLCELHRISNQMEELSTLADARRGSYESFVAVDPRLPAIYQEAIGLVGIDSPMEEVSNWLMDTQKKLKVVSVVGFGGLGKTTLAKQVYDKIREQFDCVAFISVSLRPDMRVLLNRLQLKFGINESSSDRGLDDIIEELRKYLAKKRYLIVVDDLWDQSAWNTISCAFPDNGNGSRIIVTTRVEDVAGMVCHNDLECIYTMKPLSDQNSRMLFSNRVFGSEVVCPPHLKDVAAEILKKCGGMPLAIVTIASLLATQVRSRKHWESIRKSLGAHSATNPSLKEMNSILNLSYTHLPLHLRPCFLYLGMYSEDHIIPRDDLVKQWIGEGFVSSLHGPYLEDVGRSFFNELVNRSMIQPCEMSYGEVLSCTVHDMMLDLILSKCVEDNFISVAYNFEDMARLLHRCKNKVRRLSLSSMAVGGATYDTAIAARLSQVRSLLFKTGCNLILPLLWFKYLRVLILLNGHYGWERVDLTAVSQLFQLRCLTVSADVMIKLPTKLGELVYLETLDIENCTLMNNIPSDIVHLPCLSYLLLPDFTDLPEGIENMKSLHALRGLNMEKSSLECFMGLSELTSLRELRMSVGPSLGLQKVDALACSIGKLYNLESLFIYGTYVEREDSQQLGSLSNPFQHIERLELHYWRFWRVPKWLCGLHCLRFLILSVEETSTEQIHLLGELPSLVHLELEACEIPVERAMLGTGLFPVLEFLKFWSRRDTMAYLGFEAGAMLSLRTLWIGASYWGSTVPVGMEHLLHLQEIEVYGVCINKDTEDAFKEALLMHPNRPSITIL